MAGRQEARSPVPPTAAGKRGTMSNEREKALEAVRRVRMLVSSV